MIKAKKATIESLAAMVQSGFEEMNDKMDGEFTKAHDGLAGISNRLDALEVEILDIKKQLENVVYRRELEVLQNRVAALEKRLGSMKEK